MEQLMVSVIIPAYNTEKYIGKMIECLIKQTYENMQIIFIDDGSTDRTAEVIKSYMTGGTAIDDRIEYYYQDNAGVSAARNFGLKLAKGEKIFFFDSDDTFEADLIEKCIIYSEKNHVESVLYGYGDKTEGKVTNEHEFELEGTYRGTQIVKDVLPHFLGHSYEDINKWLRRECGLRAGKEHTALWRIMLDRSVICRNNLHFDSQLSLGEDTKFINTYLLFTESVGILKETLYYLTIRENSANVTNDKNPVLMAENKEKLIKARKEIDEIAQIRGINTHKLWQGTLVLSSVQLAIRLSHCKTGGEVFKRYIDNCDVQNAIREYKPYKRTIKAIPFILLKMRLNRILFTIFKLLPSNIINSIS